MGVCDTNNPERLSSNEHIGESGYLVRVVLCWSDTHTILVSRHLKVGRPVAGVPFVDRLRHGCRSRAYKVKQAFTKRSFVRS
jgi:hypothetical protein